MVSQSSQILCRLTEKNFTGKSKTFVTEEWYFMQIFLFCFLSYGQIWFWKWNQQRSLHVHSYCKLIQSLDGHQTIIRRSLDGHQMVIRRSFRRSSDGHQTVIRQSLGGHQVVIKWSLDSHQAVIRRSLDGHQTVIRRSLGGHKTVIRWSLDNHQIFIRQ